MSSIIDILNKFGEHKTIEFDPDWYEEDFEVYVVGGSVDLEITLRPSSGYMSMTHRIYNNPHRKSDLLFINRVSYNQRDDRLRLSVSRIGATGSVLIIDRLSSLFTEEGYFMESCTREIPHTRDEILFIADEFKRWYNKCIQTGIAYRIKHEIKRE